MFTSSSETAQFSLRSVNNKKLFIPSLYFQDQKYEIH